MRKLERTLVLMLRARGWEMEPKRRGHLKFRRKGLLLVTSASPSDWRTIRNVIRDAKKQEELGDAAGQGRVRAELGRG